MDDGDKERAALLADLDGAIAALREARRLQAEHKFMRNEDLPPDLLEQIKETLRFMDLHGLGLASPAQLEPTENSETVAQPDRHTAR